MAAFATIVHKCLVNVVVSYNVDKDYALSVFYYYYYYYKENRLDRTKKSYF